MSVLAVLAATSGLAGCAGVAEDGAGGAREPAEVRAALLEQFSYADPSILFVDPVPVGGDREAPAMTPERVRRLRDAGMDIDQALAEGLAAAFRDPPGRVEVPNAAVGVRPWTGAPLETGADGVLYSVEGVSAALMRLYPVGFSTDGTRALTFVDLECGPRECGLEFVVLLRLREGGWVLESQIAERES